LELHVGFEAVEPVRARFSLLVDGVEAARHEAAGAPGGSNWLPWRLPAPRASGVAELRVELLAGAPKTVHLARPAHRAAASVAPDGSPRPRGVLLVSVDTLRPDRLGAYGSTKGLSPNLDRLAARGVVWERALSSAPWTLPSYASLFTARTPLAHGAGLSTGCQAAWPDAGDSTASHSALAPDLPTLAGQFRAAGFATAGFHASPFLEPRTGLHRGFDYWVRHAVRADAGVDQALAWIQRQKDRHWFAFVHLLDPHLPYAPPDAWALRFAGVATSELDPALFAIEELRRAEPEPERRKLLEDLYDAEVAWTDAQVGRLLDGLRAAGLAEGVVVALHSDHGEEFWEHGGFEHGHALVEEVLRVPLIVAAPGLQPGRVAARVRSLDLGPTLLELCGLPAMPGAEGASLVGRADRLLRLERESRVVDAEALLYGDIEEKARYRDAARLAWRATQAPRLVADPSGEPLDDPDLREALRAEMLERARRWRGRSESGLVEHDEAALRDLRGLGYTGIEPAEPR
jgi:arylsulfatase A-like enzyme